MSKKQLAKFQKLNWALDSESGKNENELFWSLSGANEEIPLPFCIIFQARSI